MNLQEINIIFNEYKSSFLKSRRLAIIFVVIFALLMAFYGWQKPTLFTARTTLHPNLETGIRTNNSLNPLSVIMGRVDPGMGASRIIGVLNSRTLSEMVTADTIEYQGQKALVADLVYELTPKSFSPARVLSLFRSKTTRTHRSKIVSTASSIRRNLSVAFDAEGFIEMKLTRTHPDLVRIISNTYIEKLKEYFSQQRTEKAAQDLSFLEHRRDSVKIEFDKAISVIAGFEDSYKYGILARDKIAPNEWTMKADMLRTMYLSLVASCEEALVKLQQDTPIIQILDYPDPPYIRTSASVIIHAIVGALIGLMIILLWSTSHLWKRDLRHFVIQALEGNNQ